MLSLAGDDILGTPNGRGGTTMKSRAAIVLSQWAALRAGVVCVQSEEMRRRLWTRALRERAHIVPYGVDTRVFAPGDRQEARRRMDVKAGARLVLFPNTPTEARKRLDLAQDAFERVRERIPLAELRIVSGVPHDQMAEHYRAADCVLLTSDWEGSPNVVKEALLCGTPVVSTDVGDVRRWLRLARVSEVVERSPESIADAVVRVLLNPEREDPAPFIAGYSVDAVTHTVLSLAAAATAGQG